MRGQGSPITHMEQKCGQERANWGGLDMHSMVTTTSQSNKYIKQVGHAWLVKLCSVKIDATPPYPFQVIIIAFHPQLIIVDLDGQNQMLRLVSSEFRHTSVFMYMYTYIYIFVFPISSSIWIDSSYKGSTITSVLVLVSAKEHTKNWHLNGFHFSVEWPVGISGLPSHLNTLREREKKKRKNFCCRLSTLSVGTHTKKTPKSHGFLCLSIYRSHLPSHDLNLYLWASWKNLPRPLLFLFIGCSKLVCASPSQPQSAALACCCHSLYLRAANSQTQTLSAIGSVSRSLKRTMSELASLWDYDTLIAFTHKDTLSLSRCSYVW